MAYIDSPNNPVQLGDAVYPAPVRRTLVPTWALIAMAYMTTLVVIATCASVILAPAPAYGADAGADSPTKGCTAAPVVYEDDPCWTWTRDGNGYRGVTLTSGTVRIVNACTFARLDRAHRIDWKATERLRGDALARQRNCR